MDRLKQRAAYLAARLLLRSIACAPPLAFFYTRLLDLAIPRLRRVGRRNLSLALPGAYQPQILDGVFRGIARVLIALSQFPRMHKDNIAEWIRYEGYQHFEQALQRGKGVLFATAHLGNWELSAFAHALMSAPMHVVVRPLDNPYLDAMVERLRGLSGNHILGKKDFVRSILKALHNNEAVGILVDQNSSLDEGVFVDFFGLPACTGVSFAKLAARTQAAVIPGFALWSETERKHILRFYPPVPMSGDAAADTQAIQRQLEGVIREYPDQWLWIHRRWKTRPPGDNSLYQ
ncbi:MAG: lysophospholipid acyltransferase family protein [Acidobacteria bacterium]|nr:lysophospholipid acyltransferase family protein [Acidobacteriota bacterium]